MSGYQVSLALAAPLDPKLKLLLTILADSADNAGNISPKVDLYVIAEMLSTKPHYLVESLETLHARGFLATAVPGESGWLLTISGGSPIVVRKEEQPKIKAEAWLEAMFEEFWKLYPQPRRVDLNRTRRMFYHKVHNKETFDLLMMALSRQIATIDDVRYLPNAYKWLEQERWLFNAPKPPARTVSL